jgi:hypothetical protein
LWSQSIYENEFVKQGGVWKFKAMHVYPRFIVDAEKGWAKDAQPAPGPSREFPPDRPSTETYEIYPRFSIAPLHFDHPVTGRPPQYPSGAVASAKAAEGTKATRAVVSAFRRTVQPPVKTAPALASLLAATELSVERSKAYHASENLVTAYGYYIDEFAWDDTADIFSRDGWKELSFVGTYVGRERIRQSLKLRYPNPKSPNFLTLHQIVQPVIDVSADARSAKIRVRPFQLGGPAGGEGSWISGIYENTSVNEDGTWKLSGMDLDYVWNAPSRGGWVRIKTPPTAPKSRWPGRSHLIVRCAARSPRRSPRSTPSRSITRTRCRAAFRLCCCRKSAAISLRVINRPHAHLKGEEVSQCQRPCRQSHQHCASSGVRFSRLAGIVLLSGESQESEAHS